MATPQFGVKATDLGRSNFQGTVQAGVVDKSKAMEKEADMTALAKGTELGINTYQDYDKSQVLGDVAKDIGGVITDQQDRSLAGQQALEGAIVQGADEVAIMQSEAGYDGTYPTVLNQQLTDDSLGIQNAIATKTEKLTNARQQGIMGDLELQERLGKITREAIAANPAYAAEIMGHVSAVSSMNNLTARVAADVKSISDAKDSSDARDKEVRTNAYKIGIFPEDEKYNKDGKINYDLLEKDMSEKFTEKRAYASMKLENDTNTQTEIKDVKLLIEQKQPILMNQMITNELTDFVTDLEKNTTMEPSKKIRALNTKVRELNFEVSEWYVGSGVNPNAPELKVFEDARKTQMAQIETTSIGTIDKTLDSNASANLKKLNDSTAYNTLVNMHPGLGILLQFQDLDFSNLAGGAALRFKVDSQVIKIIGDGLDPSTYLSPKTNQKNQDMLSPIPLKNGKKTSGLGLATNAALKQYLSPNQYNSSNELNERLESWTNLISGSSENTNPSVAELISTLSSPEMGQGMDAITDPSLISKLDSQINSYKPILKNGLDAFKTKFPDAKLQIRERDGMLFIPNVDNKYLPFMQNNLRSINDAARAHYNVNKLSPNGKNASAFYADILGEPDPKKAPSQ